MPCVGVCKSKYKAAGYTPSQIAAMKCICDAKPSKKYDNRYIQFFEENIKVDATGAITGDRLIEAYQNYFAKLEKTTPAPLKMTDRLDLVFKMNKHTPLKNYFQGKESSLMCTTNVKDLIWRGVKIS